MTSHSRKWHEGLVLALAMALLLLALSYVRLIGDSQSMAFSNHVLDSVFAGKIWGSTLSYNLIKFGLALLLLHLIYGTACWIMGHLSHRAWASGKTTPRQHVTLWFMLFTVAVFGNNASTFSTSSLAPPPAYSATSVSQVYHRIKLLKFIKAGVRRVGGRKRPSGWPFTAAAVPAAELRQQHRQTRPAGWPLMAACPFSGH